MSKIEFKQQLEKVLTKYLDKHIISFDKNAINATSKNECVLLIKNKAFTQDGVHYVIIDNYNNLQEFKKDLAYMIAIDEVDNKYLFFVNIFKELFDYHCYGDSNLPLGPALITLNFKVTNAFIDYVRGKYEVNKYRNFYDYKTIEQFIKIYKHNENIFVNKSDIKRSTTLNRLIFSIAYQFICCLFDELHITVEQLKVV